MAERVTTETDNLNFLHPKLKETNTEESDNQTNERIDTSHDIVTGPRNPADETIASLQSSSVAHLLDRANKLKKEKNYEAAATLYSTAIEQALAIVGGADSHPDLGPLYLQYGDLLLTISESSSDLFQPNVPQCYDDTETAQQISDSSKNNLNEDEQDVRDEQLAWEILELARICFAKSIDKVRENGFKMEDAKIIEDAAFAFLRLGDLLLMEEGFQQAGEEYKKSFSLLKEFSFPPKKYMPALVSHAQALLFGNRVIDALKCFKEAHHISLDILSDDTSLSLESREAMQTTSEDLEIQIEELQSQIHAGLFDISETIKEKNSSSESLLEKTGALPNRPAENPYAVPKLDSEIVDLGILKSKKPLTSGCAAGDNLNTDE